MSRVYKILFMKIIVFGATGRTGKQIVHQALNAGHLITAVARNPAALDITHPGLTIIKGDVLQLHSFENTLKGFDAVFSLIGKDATRPTTLYSQGVSNIMIAMQKNNVKRLIAMSAAAVVTNPRLSFLLKIATKILQRILKHPFADILRMEKAIQRSNLDYTIVRPPKLTNKPLTGQYRFAINEWLAHCTSISRADLAHFMIHIINDSKTYQSTIEISY